MKKISDYGYYETKKHCDAMRPFNIYPCTIPQDFSFVPLHWQDSMEFIYIKKGMGTAQIHLDVFTVYAEDILVIPPGVLHGLKAIRGSRMEYENIIFELSFLGSSMADVCSQKYLIPVQSSQMIFPQRLCQGSAGYESIKACLDDIDRLCSGRPDGYELGIKGNLLKIMGLFFENGKVARADGNDNNTDKLKQLLDKIENDYMTDFSVEKAANECGYSSSHFMRWFKQMTGSSFNHYLNAFRLEKAAQLLKQTREPVLNIASNVGFDNLSNFNRQFKDHFQMTPGDYRRSSQIK